MGCTSYVARITLARKCINDGTFLVGRNAFILNGWKGSPGAVNNTRIDSKETFSYGLPNLTLESQGSSGGARNSFDPPGKATKRAPISGGARNSPTEVLDLPTGG